MGTGSVLAAVVSVRARMSGTNAVNNDNERWEAMSVQTRAYDNEHGDPVVVLVATGTFDVSRLINLHAGKATPRCEDGDYADRMLRQVKRHNGGRAALKLLKDHGGPDFSEESTS